MVGVPGEEHVRKKKQMLDGKRVLEFSVDVSGMIRTKVLHA